MKFTLIAIGIIFGGWFGFWFLRGAYWAATGRPMPPRPGARKRSR